MDYLILQMSHDVDIKPRTDNHITKGHGFPMDMNISVLIPQLLVYHLIRGQDDEQK